MDAVRLAVATGELLAGEQLPSVRALAERLVINPNTVARAYAELSRDGLLDSQAGKGLFVGKARQIFTRAERLRRLEPVVDALVNQAVALNFSEQDICQAISKRFASLGVISKSSQSQEGGNS